MTKWTCETWWDLREDKKFFTRLLEKTGCLMTVNGSGDEKILLKGLKDYVKKSFAQGRSQWGAWGQSTPQETPETIRRKIVLSCQNCCDLND